MKRDYAQGLAGYVSAAFRHFHSVKWFNDKLTTLRREVYREADTQGKVALKDSRWLLLKAPEHLKRHPE